MREPGQPIAGRPVYMPPGGTYLIEGVLDVVDKPVMMVGHDALVGYARETGRYIPDIYDPRLSPALTSLEPTSLLAMEVKLQRLLGDEYERLEQADARGRLSRTPPASRHRLIELIDFVRTTANALRSRESSAHIDLDGDLLAEAVTVLAAASRWGKHSAWPALQAALASDAEAPHTVMLLTVASYLVDADNGVGLHVNTSRQHVSTADMWIEPSLDQRVDVEVKTPIGLRRPRSPVSEPKAVRILEKALKKSSRQRRNTRTNLLILGGYHMGASYGVIASTAKAMLALERKRWKSLAGIVVADCTYEMSASKDGQSTGFTPVARIDIARHPGYHGDLSIISDPQPPPRFSTGK